MKLFIVQLLLTLMFFVMESSSFAEGEKPGASGTSSLLAGSSRKRVYRAFQGASLPGVYRLPANTMLPPRAGSVSIKAYGPSFSSPFLCPTSLAGLAPGTQLQLLFPEKIIGLGDIDLAREFQYLFESSWSVGVIETGPGNHVPDTIQASGLSLVGISRNPKLRIHDEHQQNLAQALEAAHTRLLNNNTAFVLTTDRDFATKQAGIYYDSNDPHNLNQIYSADLAAFAGVINSNLRPSAVQQAINGNWTINRTSGGRQAAGSEPAGSTVTPVYFFGIRNVPNWRLLLLSNDPQVVRLIIERP